MYKEVLDHILWFDWVFVIGMVVSAGLLKSRLKVVSTVLNKKCRYILVNTNPEITISEQEMVTVRNLRDKELVIHQWVKVCILVFPVIGVLLAVIKIMNLNGDPTSIESSEYLFSLISVVTGIGVAMLIKILFVRDLYYIKMNEENILNIMKRFSNQDSAK